MSTYSPAGIFSTDDAQADASQILAESYVDEEVDEAGGGREVKLYAACSLGDCHWYDYTDYDPSDRKDKEFAKTELIRMHNVERPNCTGKVLF